MEVVIIAVSDRSLLWRDGSIEKEKYQQFVQEYAEFLAQHFENVLVTPDDGVYTDVAEAFGKVKGKKPIAYYPDQDTFYGYEHLKPNFPKFELRKINGDWYKLNGDLTKQSKIVISLGWSPGVLVEGSFIKYHQRYGSRKDPSLKNIHWFVDERCISQRLPKAFEEQIENLSYFKSFEALVELIHASKSKTSTR